MALRSRIVQSYFHQVLVLKSPDFGENGGLLKPDIPVLYGYRRLPPDSKRRKYDWTILERKSHAKIAKRTLFSCPMVVQNTFFSPTGYPG